MQLTLDTYDLQPLIEQVVAETIAKIEANQAKLNGRLAYSEPEAAALIGVQQHVLRDCRLRGEIQASKAGKRWLYQRDELLRFLNRRAP